MVFSEFLIADHEFSVSFALAYISPQQTAQEAKEKLLGSVILLKTVTCQSKTDHSFMYSIYRRSRANPKNMSDPIKKLSDPI